MYACVFLVMSASLEANVLSYGRLDKMCWDLCDVMSINHVWAGALQIAQQEKPTQIERKATKTQIRFSIDTHQLISQTNTSGELKSGHIFCSIIGFQSSEMNRADFPSRHFIILVQFFYLKGNANVDTKKTTSKSKPQSGPDETQNNELN